MRSAGIAGLGKAVPEKILTNLDLERMVETSDQWIVERTGIHERRIVGDGESASTLAVQAGRDALRNGGIAPEQVDLVICATISGDMPFPATASLVQNALGATRAAAFDLQAGCSGFAYALAVGAQFVQTGGYDTVLVVGVDVLSRMTDWTDRATCVLFGDGAGAAVLRPVADGAGLLSFDLGSDGSGGELLKIEAGGSRKPASAETVAGREHFIKMDGREVFKFAVKIMGESAERALAQCGIPASDVDLFVPHQANVRIIESATRRLDIPPEKVFVNVGKYGNTSAGSIPIALHEAYYSGRIREGNVIVTVGFGAGLTWASCVMRWTLPTVQTVSADQEGA